MVGGSFCPAGGKQIDVGLDDNRNGVLDPVEVDDTTYVCNGVDGSNGSNGSNGNDGVDGEDGADGNDGIDGADGADGVDGEDGVGHNALVCLVPISAGDECAAGGTAIESGLDDNDDGVLGDEAVTARAPVCNGTGTVGPEGPQGPAGQDGVDGLDGLDGVDGADGIDGAGCASSPASLFALPLLGLLRRRRR